VSFELKPRTEAGRRFVEAAETLIPVLREHADQADRSGEMSRASFEALVESGVAAAFVPEALGGFGRYDEALEALRGAGHGLRAQQLRALALGKIGRVEDALAILEPLYEDGQRDPETVGILAGILKREGRNPERAFELYEGFRPKIPAGQRGWGAKGRLDLERVRRLAARTS